MTWDTEGLADVYSDWLNVEQPDLALEYAIVCGLEAIRADPSTAADHVEESPDIAGTLRCTAAVGQTNRWLVYSLDLATNVLTAHWLGLDPDDPEPHGAVRPGGPR